MVSPDRLARSLSHLLAVIKDLQARGAAAQLERALIRERTKSGMRAAAARSKRAVPRARRGLGGEGSADLGGAAHAPGRRLAAVAGIGSRAQWHT